MTNPLHELKETFRPRAERADDLFLLSASDAASFVQRGISLGFRLAGVEGFAKTEKGAYQPQQDFSNDAVDSQLTPEVFISDTLRLIEKGGLGGILFQVIFEP